MEAQTTAVTIQDTTSNPAPLGLLGFGMTTVLLNLHNAGLFELSSMILAMGIFYGGIAQIIAGLIEVKKKNTFGATAFISYGFFWLSFVGLLVLPKTGWTDASSGGAISAYLLLWGLFTAFMYVGTLKLSRSLQFVFGSLTILFVLLAVGILAGNALIGQIAGIEGVICGLSAIYTAMAHVLNEIYKRNVLPM
jgi:uncharacterized protein